jgi:hypothetical protein
MEDIKVINKMLLELNSISQVEKTLGYGKDTLRKKLNRQGYRYNKDSKQYELRDINLQLKDVPVPKKDITQVVTHSYEMKKDNGNSRLTDKQIDVLHRIIKEYELREQIKISHLDKGELGNRNVRVYIDHFNQFANWCKSQGITQADGLYEAINMFMKNVGK